MRLNGFINPFQVGCLRETNFPPLQRGRHPPPQDLGLLGSLQPPLGVDLHFGGISWISKAVVWGLGRGEEKKAVS